MTALSQSDVLIEVRKTGDWKPTKSVYNEKLRQTVWLLEEFILLNPVAVIVCSACSLIYLLYSLVPSFNVTRVSLRTVSRTLPVALRHIIN